jgi:hypothetical protein
MEFLKIFWMQKTSLFLVSCTNLLDDMDF